MHVFGQVPHFPCLDGHEQCVLSLIASNGELAQGFFVDLFFLNVSGEISGEYCYIHRD